MDNVCLLQQQMSALRINEESFKVWTQTQNFEYWPEQCNTEKSLNCSKNLVYWNTKRLVERNIQIFQKCNTRNFLIFSFDRFLMSAILNTPMSCQK